MSMKKYLFVIALIVLTGFSLKAQKKSDALPERTISVDVNQVKGPLSKNFKECIGAGRANEGLRADWQQQLAMVQKEIGFKYIRMHGLLNDDMGVYKEDKKGNPSYNFQYIDQLYDYLLSINIKPFVELAFMPKDLASGSQTIFWWNGNITPPKSYEKWYELIKALVTHFKERYGKDEIKPGILKSGTNLTLLVCSFQKIWTNILNCTKLQPKQLRAFQKNLG
jgi:xylan 1,4-beta-xylosidase